VVASAAISSLVRIAQFNSDIVKRCTNEIQEALNSDSPMVQYHALGLCYTSCKDNQIALLRLISDCIEQDLRSPLAICLLIRIILSFINDNCGKERQMFCNYIKNHLGNQSEMVEFEAARALINIKDQDTKAAAAHLRNFLSSPKASLRFASVRSLNESSTASKSNVRFWSVHRIGSVCRLHLLNKRYRFGDHILGILDFSNSKITCAKYTVMLQCEETQQCEIRQEFSLGMKKNDFMITIPQINSEASVLHCVLSFLFYIADKNYPKTLFEDRAGTIELGPSELDIKLFSCDFPIAMHI